jgi:hypothetical protein
VTWKKDHVKETQEFQNSQQHQDRGPEEERNSLEHYRGPADIHEGTDIQRDRCQELNEDVTTM